MPALLDPAIQGGFTAAGVLLGVGLQNLVDTRRTSKLRVMEEANELVFIIGEILSTSSQNIIYASNTPFWEAQAEAKSRLRVIATLSKRKFRSPNELFKLAEECVYQIAFLEGMYIRNMKLTDQKAKIRDAFDKMYLEIFPVSEDQKRRIEKALSN